MLRRWKSWGVLVLAFLTLGLTIACQGNPSSQVGESASADCRPVEHVAGTTCVPNAFERLVALDMFAFESAIALGVKPVAAVLSDYSPHLATYANDVENIGQQGEPNLESVLAVRPDLIVGQDYYQSIYPQASRIAPTVLFGFEHSGQWKEVFHTLSGFLGKADVEQKVMADYNQRLDEFKAAMGVGATSPEENRLQQTQVSIVRIYPDSISLYLRDSFAGTILQDAGLGRPAAQDIGAEDAQRIINNPIQKQISRELLSQADGDVLFIWTSENDPQANQEAQKKLEELQNDPLWNNLNAVRNNKVHLVPQYWIGGGPLAANAIIDDLFKYLVETSQS